MAVVTEVATLEDGRELTMRLTDEEHKYILSAGVAFLLRTGLLVLNAEREEAIAVASEAAKTETKQ
jgi:hypothetical protein